MVLVGHNDLNGNGDGGEGLALQQFPDGRKVLYLAHEAPARCLSVIDVTKPEAPVMVNQLPSPAPGVTRCNSLGLSGTVLAVANQAAKAGGKLAGMWVLDVSSFDRVKNGQHPRRPEALVLRHLGPAVARRPQPLVRGRRVRPPHHRHARFQPDP